MCYGGPRPFTAPRGSKAFTADADLKKPSVRKPFLSRTSLTRPSIYLRK